MNAKLTLELIQDSGTQAEFFYPLKDCPTVAFCDSNF